MDNFGHMGVKNVEDCGKNVRLVIILDGRPCVLVQIRIDYWALNPGVSKLK
jgi:hypothetical protein